MENFLKANRLSIEENINPIVRSRILGHPKINPFSGKYSMELWEKAHSVESNYKDTFDYGIYDRLADRYPDPPRGGVIFKTPIKLLETGDCENCFHRFEIDTYGRGCIHNCEYCYAKAYLYQRKYWNEPIPFPVDIAEIRKIFATVFETDKKHKFRSLLENRIPLRVGSMSDSFMWMDKKYRVSLELLKILKFYKYPYIVFTRSDLIAEDEYLKLIDPDIASIQMSISSMNDKLTKKIEPGAPSPTKRLKALQKISEAGIWTTVRINPLFPIYPDGYFTNPDFDRSKVTSSFPFFSWDMIETISQHNIPTVLVGVVRLYFHNLRFMSKALGFDFKSFFDSESKMERAALHFSASETAYYYCRIRDLANKYGIRFSTCYIGNDTTGESFYKYQDLWTNKKDCCDAVGNVSGFRKTCATLPKSKPSINVPPKHDSIPVSVELFS